MRKKASKPKRPAKVNLFWQGFGKGRKSCCGKNKKPMDDIKSRLAKKAEPLTKDEVERRQRAYEHGFIDRGVHGLMRSTKSKYYEMGATDAEKFYLPGGDAALSRAQKNLSPQVKKELAAGGYYGFDKY